MQGIISSVGNRNSGGGQGGPIDTYIRISCDISNITPSTVSLNGKEYNEYTLTENDMTITGVTSLNDEEAMVVSDLLNYKLFPISNNNNDTGLTASYDGNTLIAKVATTQNISSVDFYFCYIYSLLPYSGVVADNYVDLILTSQVPPASNNTLHRMVLDATTATTVTFNATARNARIYVIGGGGGGGGGIKYSNYRNAGGGGASGELATTVIDLFPGYVISYYCGVGGRHGTTVSGSSSGNSKGGNGSATNVNILNSQSVSLYTKRCGGGQGGGSASSSGGGVGGSKISNVTANNYMIVGSSAYSDSPGCGGLTPYIPYGCGGDGGFVNYDMQIVDATDGGNGVIIIEWVE